MGRLCLIPARGGSKRIPGKNLKLLNGVPLLKYTIDSAIESKLFDDIIVSTDDKSIADLAVKCGVKIDLRPEALADDRSTTIDVALEFLNRSNNKNRYETITVLLPTCPFRTAQHIKEAFGIFECSPEIPFLISVSEYEFPIQLALVENSDGKFSCLSENEYNIPRTQDFEKRYHPNGAIYLAKVPNFIKEKTFFAKSFLAYKMDYVSSYDIDYPHQFLLADLYSKNLESIVDKTQ